MCKYVRLYKLVMEMAMAVLRYFYVMKLTINVYFAIKYTVPLIL